MAKKTFAKVALIGVAAVALTACTTYRNQDLAFDSTNQEMGADSYAVAGANKFDGKNVAKADGLRHVHTFYFDFDKYALHDEAKAALTAHATYLKQHPKAHIRLEGHTDERGSREYNVALGEHRAQTVEHFLEAQGVAPSQIDVVSFGKEKPAEIGHNAHAWQKNRRAVVVYEKS